MKYYFLLICCLMITSIFAQRREKNESVEVVIDTEVDFETNTISNLTVINPSTLKDPHIALASGDLLINYELDRNTKGNYSISILEIISARGVQFAIKPENIYGDFGENISTQGSLEKSILLANTADNDNLKWLDGRIRVRLKVEHYVITVNGRQIDCNHPPIDLKIKDFTPELIVGGVGLATFAAGMFIDHSSDKLYADYEAQDRKLTADPIFEKADKRHKEAFVTKGAGIAILVGTLFFAARKKIKNRQEKKYFKIYCQKYTLEPFYQLGPGIALPESQVGVSLKFSF